MVKIKSVDDIATKWADVTPGRAPYYEAEMKVAGEAWKDGAKKGQKAYESAMADPDTLKRREKEITDAAAEKLERLGSKLGPARFRAGIPETKVDYTSGFTPFHGVISAWVKPERGPRGDAKNYDIVKSIGDALHKKRVGAS